MDINKKISHLIANQFPSHYQENGSLMVDFVESYYEFLENTYGYSEYMARSMPENNDIDKTLDEFVVHFKNKYLSEFPYVTYADKRTMIKHIMDFYRSKGSEKSVKLLMKMIFGEEAEVYYPAKDILRASSSKWRVPRYIEVESRDRNFAMTGKKIIGSVSKATASVDGVVRKRVNGSFIDVMYLNDVSNEFVINDLITEDGNLNDAPTVLGSLFAIQVLDGGINYNLGDIVDIEGAGGEYGTGVVTGVENLTDKVTYTLIDGGYGYTLDQYTEVLISEIKLRISNAIPTLTTLDNVYQYKFQAPTTYALAEDLIGETVAVYDGTVFKSNAVVLDAVNSSHFILGLSDWTSKADYDSNLSGFDRVRYIDGSSFTEINFESSPAPADKTTLAYAVGSQGYGLGLKYHTSNTNDISLPTAGNKIAHVQDEFGTSYTFEYIEGGSGFDFDVGTLTKTQTVDVDTSIISNSAYYTSSVSPILSSTIQSQMNEVSMSIGEIASLKDFSPGSGYESDPLVAILNSPIESLRIKDKFIRLNLTSGATLSIGDEVRKGSQLFGYIREFNFDDATNVGITVRTVSTTLDIYQSDTIGLRQDGGGADYITGTVSTVSDLSDPSMGINANIDPDVFVAQGTITDIRIKNSGFGYRNNQVVRYRSAENGIYGTGIAIANKTGTGTGYWETTTSHLNSDKKIRDSVYYQEYSYEIQSGISLSDYEDTVNDTVHVAGTKLFGRVINKSVGEIDLSANADSKIDITN